MIRGVCVCVCARVCVCMQLNCVWLFVTPWTIVSQSLLSMEFPRQEYWSGLLLPFPGALPNPRIEPESPASPALAGVFFTSWATIIRYRYTSHKMENVRYKDNGTPFSAIMDSLRNLGQGRAIDSDVWQPTLAVSSWVKEWMLWVPWSQIIETIFISNNLQAWWEDPWETNEVALPASKIGM